MMWSRMFAGRVAIASSAMLAASLASPARLAAQQDCAAARADWSNIQLFRSCLARSGLNAWGVTANGRSVLHDAALETGNPTIVAILLEAGANPNARDDEGNTALYLGVWNENPMVTAHLLGAGADPNAANNLGYAPLHIASTRDNARAIRLLLDAGANPGALSNDGWTPLHNAAFFGAHDGIAVLLDGGADEGLAPLHRAVLMANPGAVSAVLDAGADPDATDAHGWNALHFAAPMAGPEIVARLLQAGADPKDGTANGLSALHLAGDGATVAALVGAGTDIEARSDLGRTPLHQASLFRAAEVVEALLDAGADVEAVDGNGERPRDLAGRNPGLEGSAVLGRLGGGPHHPAFGVIVRGRYPPQGA